ncbi:hypothetical protein [Novosphingobium mathurense]|uniref:Uncharacterized protein n=1 Tax=Novosphingobium mathurense TaxID=428990 RepID=A0A1U6GTQ3_9SPHN|nr:hypothetical protein [Novosphingobium mathurense]SLJ86902.1 hypothetical protein SAMN06295987_101411 [Novosphingobium mathurense]
MDIDYIANRSAAEAVITAMARHNREELATFVAVAIDIMDAMDGDIDLEDGDVDRCNAHDDSLEDLTDWRGYPGDPDDTEDGDEDRCEAADDGCGGYLRHGIMHYGSDDDDADFEAWEQPVALGGRH